AADLSLARPRAIAGHPASRTEGTGLPQHVWFEWRRRQIDLDHRPRRRRAGRDPGPECAPRRRDCGAACRTGRSPNAVARTAYRRRGEMSTTCNRYRASLALTAIFALSTGVLLAQSTGG